MKTKVLILLITFVVLFAHSQVLTNGLESAAVTAENPFFDASTNFDASVSPNNEGKGLVFPRVDLTTWTFKIDLLDGISFPTAFNGMIVYNTGTGVTLTGSNNPDNASTVEPGFYYFSNTGSSITINNGKWVRLISQFISGTSNGSSVVSAYNCTTAPTGTLTVGVTALGVSQTITATVVRTGTYNLSVTVNGVTFAASGTFATIGAQYIVLTATGTPISAAASPYSYVLNVAASGCSFDRVVWP